MTERVLVTGGLGFIGSRFVQQAAASGDEVSVIDTETYAADRRRLEGIGDQIDVVMSDVADQATTDVVRSIRPDVIVHFAAATHVTRSENEGETFFRTNVEGTRLLLDACEAIPPRLFVHISTDEVYGPCRATPFREEQKEPGEGRATSAYARSKAVADDLAVAAMGRLPVIVTRLTNCYGPWQHPEKAIPRWTLRALNGERLPVWGDGRQVRQWMHRDDACEALWMLCQEGQPGSIYNVAPPTSEVTNLQVAQEVARAAGEDLTSVYLTAYDRPDHDRRYAIDAAKIAATGWRSKISLAHGLSDTVAWYRENRAWWEPLLTESERLYDDAVGLDSET